MRLQHESVHQLGRQVPQLNRRPRSEHCVPGRDRVHSQLPVRGDQHRLQSRPGGRLHVRHLQLPLLRRGCWMPGLRQPLEVPGSSQLMRAAAL